jgi:hypothetical protein
MNIIGSVYTAMIGYSPLVTAMGSADQITRNYPDIVTKMPLVSLGEANNSDAMFYDNQPNSANERVDVHVFTDYETPTTTVADIVSDLMKSLLFTRDYQADMDDPSAKLRHKVMKFSRDNIVSPVLT